MDGDAAMGTPQTLSSFLRFVEQHHGLVEIASYAAVFGIFALFVRVAKQVVREAERPPPDSGWCYWLAWKCSSDNQRPEEYTQVATEGPDVNDDDDGPTEAPNPGRWGCGQKEMERAMQLIYCMAGIQVGHICHLDPPVYKALPAGVARKRRPQASPASVARNEPCMFCRCHSSYGESCKRQ